MPRCNYINRCMCVSVHMSVLIGITGCSLPHIQPCHCSIPQASACIRRHDYIFWFVQTHFLSWEHCLWKKNTRTAHDNAVIPMQWHTVAPSCYPDSGVRWLIILSETSPWWSTAQLLCHCNCEEACLLRASGGGGYILWIHYLGSRSRGDIFYTNLLWPLTLLVTYNNIDVFLLLSF